MDEARGPEDRIEHIVREAEGAAQFEFNSGAWSAMEAKLDAAAPVPFIWWKLLFPIAGTAILLALLLWPMAASDIERVESSLSKQTATKEQAVAADKVTVPEKQTEAVEDAVSSQQAGDPQSSGNPSVAATDNSEEKIDPSAESVTSNDPNAKPTELAKTAETSESQTNRVDAESSKNKVEESVEQTSGKEANEAQPLDGYRYRAAVQGDVSTAVTGDESQKESLALGGSEAPEAEDVIAALSIRWVPRPLIFPEPQLVFEVDSSIYSKEAPEVDYFQKSRWAFSLALSADLSATGLEGFTDPGTMVGFGVEYYFANNWSIQTGATYAVKKYTALGEEYQAPDWISARPNDLLSASAICRVIDIPFNIRKYFQNKKGNTFFVSTGVSTYLMLREDYNYEYTEERPGWLPFWSYRNRNNHFFGILNLSVGYEKPLGKNLALSIEPFMKLPLTGIGEGRVRFLSFGTNIAIKLRK